MKQSLFYKNYFNFLSKKNSSSLPLVFQLSFFSNAEVLVFRQLLVDFNKNFKKPLLGFYFFSQGSLTTFENKSSSFNYIFISTSVLSALAFFDSVLRLNLGFLISSFSSENIFTVNFFKAFLGNKFLVQSVFSKIFAERFLIFIKRIEYFNRLKFLGLLKKIKV
jgi:hypothetical protein